MRTTLQDSGYQGLRLPKWDFPGKTRCAHRSRRGRLYRYSAIRRKREFEDFPDRSRPWSGYSAVTFATVAWLGKEPYSVSNSKSASPICRRLLVASVCSDFFLQRMVMGAVRPASKKTIRVNTSQNGQPKDFDLGFSDMGFGNTLLHIWKAATEGHRYRSLARRRSVTCLGFGLVGALFMTFPVRKLMSFSLPALTAATSSGFSAMI